MKQKQFDKRNLKASASLNRFDLSNRTTLTAPFGMLIPCMVRHLVGKTKVRLENEHQVRVNALNAPAFSRMRQHYDYFFVPYSQLYRFYDNFKTQQSNYNSALFESKNQGVVNQLPYFTGQDMWEIVHQDSQQPQIDDLLGYDIRYGHRRLFDLLKYGNIPMRGFIGDWPYLNSKLRLNPFAGLAYQKIYYDYYRNDKYEANDSEAYNIDDLNQGTEISTDRLRKIFQIRYRWRRKDYFTQVTPDVLPSSTQFGRANFNSSLKVLSQDGIITDDLFNQFSLPGTLQYDTLVDQASSIKNPDQYDNLDLPRLQANTLGSQVRFPSNVTQRGGTTVQNLSSTVTSLQQSVPQHRLAVARQKLLERMYAAHSDFSSQMLAIFGYAPTEGRYGNVKHIGGFSDVIQIADVDNTTATRSTGTAVFGKINNVNSNKRYLEYECPEDGILMCIFSTDMLQDYDSYRLDRFNFKNVPEDFFNPYYESLGKQALYSVEYATVAYDTENSDYVPTTPAVIGFVPRYSEYKSVIDEVHGEFCKWGTKNYMVAPTNLDFEKQHPYLYIRNLVLDPSQINPILPFDYNGTEETDAFELNLYNSVKVLAPMQKIKEY